MTWGDVRITPKNARSRSRARNGLYQQEKRRTLANGMRATTSRVAMMRWGIWEEMKWRPRQELNHYRAKNPSSLAGTPVESSDCFVQLLHKAGGKCSQVLPMHGEALNRPTWCFIRMMENEPFAVVSRESPAWTPVLVRCSHVSRMKRLRIP